MTDTKKDFTTSSPKPVPPPRVDFVVEDSDAVLPPYIESVYKRRYFSPSVVRFFQKGLMTTITNWFMQSRLVRLVADEIYAEPDVLQFGIADGKLQNSIAEKMNGQGVYHIEDLSKPQIENTLPSVSPWLNVRLLVRDFTHPTDKKYDVAVLFFTLHELPDARKTAVIKRAFNALKPSGKIVFIDYAQPHAWHPLKYPLRQFNRLFEPFAESLWYKDIQDFAPAEMRESKTTIWSKKTILFGLYQCVIVQKR